MSGSERTLLRAGYLGEYAIRNQLGQSAQAR